MYVYFDKQAGLLTLCPVFPESMNEHQIYRYLELKRKKKLFEEIATYLEDIVTK